MRILIIILLLLLTILLHGCRNRITLENDVFYPDENSGNIYKSRQVSDYRIGGLN